MEKTFEELIENYIFYDRSDYPKKEPLLDKADVLQILQQVREATISECERLIVDEDCAIYKLNQLPTDRIKIEAPLGIN